MTEQELRQLVVKTIEGWVGRKESDGTHKHIIDIYNAHKPLPSGYKVKYTDSWCATTVSATFIEVGLTDIAPKECSCGRMVEQYKKIGKWQENDSYRPKPGDIIMYDWDDSGVGDNTGWPDHVGIVTSISGNTMKIVEGNISNAVGYRSIQIGAKNIRGYCLPDYASKANEPEQDTSSNTYTVKKGDSLWSIAKKFLGDGARYPELVKMNGLSSTHLKAGQVLKIKEFSVIAVGLPVLRSGDEGAVVEAMQYLLLCHGFGLPQHGPDGKFGDETESALASFQKSNSLEITKVCDERTWTKLLKG